MARKPIKAKTKKKASRGSSQSKKRSLRRFPWFRVLISLFVLLAGYMVYLDMQVFRQFEGKRWSLPARVYARPLELYTGVPLSADQFARELKALGYRFVKTVQRPGEVSRAAERFHLISRGFQFWDGQEPSHSLRLQFSSGKLQSMAELQGGQNVALARLEPLQIGAIHTAHHEDRVLVKRDAVPELLVQTLIAVEDRDFYQHFGISLRGIGRAMWANVRAGSMVQGGSTITQQLVKNFFLTNRRSLLRKINEALMALLVERRYEKDEILEAYLNEVYLAQDGNRAIHGFGLASQHFFARPVEELSAEQIALLIGMVKGPSYYDPLRKPQRAKERRDLVLEVMAEQGLISPQEAGNLREKPLQVESQAPQSNNRAPAFMEVLRLQLQRDYQEADLHSEGLRIFSTLDPEVQWWLETALTEQSTRVEHGYKITPDSLQGAGVVTSVGGEVLALVGDRSPRAAGFNRALNARRPVGSLLKPAVFLAALEQPSKYTLTTLLDDEPLHLKGPADTVWEPQNYDKVFHGQVPLLQSLVHSYNVATARLGMDLGLDTVIETLHRLGLEQTPPAYPSLILGAVDLSPWDVTGLYQTLASGGFRTPLRAIREVMAADGSPLQRYPLEVEAAVAPAPLYLLTVALQEVVAQGTAAGLAQWLDPGLRVAGKTGTTDDLRDSWFAGFSGDRLAVVWLGRDDNQPMGLTGASGAMQVWGQLFSHLPTQVLEPTPPEDIEWQWVDTLGLRAEEACPEAVQLPFIRGSVPLEISPCVDAVVLPPGNPINWIRNLFN